MSKETVAGIGKAIQDAQRAKELREQQEAAKRQAESLRQEARHQALFARNEASLRATGVVGLFEELRDSKVLTMTKGGDQAIINWDPDRILTSDQDRTVISIEFDEHVVERTGSDYNNGYDTRTLSLSASLSKYGTLQVNGHLMEPGEKLEDVVRDEILRLKGLKTE